LPFNEWGNVAAVNVKRKYYSCQTEPPSRAQFRDPIDALKIGIFFRLSFNILAQKKQILP
jgi:hypothetical protein